MPQVIERVKVIRTLEIEVPNLGAKIKQARKKASEQGKTITDLASASGMSAQNWYRIENERQTLPEETLRLMESALGHDFGVSFAGD
ncbi:MAG: helix-turn-helix domain-containing protein [Phormidesmis sp.]